MQQPNAPVWHLFAQVGVGGLCRLQVECFAFFNKWAYPVGLLPFVNFAFNGGDQLFTFFLREQFGDDGFSARWFFVQVGYGQIRQISLSQRSRNGRGAHHELMRQLPIAGLGNQRQPLCHAKAVLFIHHHQGKGLEFNMVLHQRMGANHNVDFAAGQCT